MDANQLIEKYELLSDREKIKFNNKLNRLVKERQKQRQQEREKLVNELNELKK